MREGRNVGKVVLTVPAPLDPDGTVLITGGTGGLGGAVRPAPGRQRTASGTCCWSAAAARPPRAPASCVAELTALGAEVEVVACDVADRGAAGRCCSGRCRQPLTAVCTRPACWTTASSNR